MNINVMHACKMDDLYCTMCVYICVLYNFCIYVAGTSWCGQLVVEGFIATSNNLVNLDLNPDWQPDLTDILCRYSVHLLKFYSALLHTHTTCIHAHTCSAV